MNRCGQMCWKGPYTIDKVRPTSSSNSLILALILEPCRRGKKKMEEEEKKRKTERDKDGIINIINKYEY